MAPDPRPIELEWLLGERDWLFRLARSLVRDASAAEDVVQETWLAALVRPPAASERGRRRAFLATILRRVARATQRGEAAREARERARGRFDAAPSEVEGLERLALQRLVADAVLELGEPARTAIVLRYVEGLTPREIAARNGESSAAVRTRLSRALELLRERLDREHGGDRAEWRALFTTWLGRFAPPAVLGGTVTGGLLAMKVLFLKVAAGAAVALALVLWSARSNRQPAEAVPRLAREPVTDAADPAPASVAPSAAVQREEAPVVETVPAAALRGRVRSRSDRAPLAGAAVELRRPVLREPASERLRDLELRASRGEAVERDAVRAHEREAPEIAAEPLARTHADDSGEFAFAELPGGELELVASAAGHVTRAVALDPAVRVHEVELAPAVELEVRIVDAAGRGLAGERVAVVALEREAGWRLAPPSAALGHGPSDAAGRVVVGGLPGGGALRVELVPSPPRPLHSDPVDTVLAERESTVVVLRVNDTGALAGTVANVPGGVTAVHARFTPDVAARCFRAPVEDGAFLLEGLPAGPGTLELELLSLGTRARHRFEEARRVEVVAGATTDVGLLAPPDVVRLAGRVSSFEDATSNDFVALEALRGGRVVARTHIDGEGRFELELEAGPCVVEVVLAGRVLAAVRAEAPDDDLVLDLVTLAAALRGHLPAELAGARYLLPLLVRGDPAAPGFAVPTQPEHGMLVVSSGRFRMLPLEAGPHALFVAFGARGAAWLPRLALERGRETDVGELVVGHGAVDGRLSGAAPERLAGRALTLVSPFGSVVTTHAERHAVADAEGAFRFDDVPAGPWRVRTADMRELAGASPALDVFPGETARCELVLAASARLLVELERAGETASGVPLGLARVDGAPAERAERSGADGRLALELAAGEWELSVGADPVERVERLRLAPGEARTLAIDLAGAARAFVLDARDEPGLVVLAARAWRLCTEPALVMRRARACSGRGFELDVEPGTHLLELEVADAEGRGLRFLRVEVVAGEAEVRVRLDGLAPRVRLVPDAHGSAPRVRITALGECSAEALDLELPGRAHPGGVRYPMVPRGTRLSVTGIVPGSGPDALELVVEPGSEELDWPR